jgi:hypothetical protein
MRTHHRTDHRRWNTDVTAHCEARGSAGNGPQWTWHGQVVFTPPDMKCSNKDNNTEHDGSLRSAAKEHAAATLLAFRSQVQQHSCSAVAAVGPQLKAAKTAEFAGEVDAIPCGRIH